MEFEPLDQFQQRRKKLSELEALGHSAYPRKFEWTHTPRQIVEQSIQANPGWEQTQEGRIRVMSSMQQGLQREKDYQDYAARW